MRDVLDKVRLGETDLEVPGLCIGCAPLGDMPETFEYSVSEERARETLLEAFGSGLGFLDTAASYGDGESERRIGQVLREIGGVPEGCVIATKADRDLATGEFSGDQMRRSVERSLGLLGLDSLPLVYLHDPEHGTFDEMMSPGGPVEALVSLREEGVIGHLGVAGGPVGMMIRYVETGIFEAAITHNRYTLVDRSAQSLLDTGVRLGVPVLNAAPYGSGILAKGPDIYARYAYEDASEELVQQVRDIQRVCSRYEVPLAAAALQFSTTDERISSTIVGISRPERIEQTIELARFPVPDGFREDLERVLPR